jgi:hypothetical protein
VYERLYGRSGTAANGSRGPSEQGRVLVDTALLPPPEPEPRASQSPPRRSQRPIVLPAAAVGALLGVALLVLLGSGDDSGPRPAGVVVNPPKPERVTAPAQRKHRARRRHRRSTRQRPLPQTGAAAPQPVTANGPQPVAPDTPAPKRSKPRERNERRRQQNAPSPQSKPTPPTSTSPPPSSGGQPSPPTTQQPPPTAPAPAPPTTPDDPGP